MFFRKKRCVAIVALVMMSSIMNSNMVHAVEVKSDTANIPYISSDVEEKDMQMNFNESQFLKTGGVEEITTDEISEEEMDEIPAFNEEANWDESDEENSEESENVCNYGSKNEISCNTTRGRDSLANLINGDNMQMAYDTITEYFKGIHDGNYIAPTAKNNKYVLDSLKLSSYDLTSDQLKKIFLAIRYDHPEFFWIGSGYSYSTLKSNKCVSKASFYIQSNFIDSNYIKREKSEINKVLAEYLEAVEGYSDEYKIEKIFHDKIIKETLYDPNYAINENVNVNCHNIAGVFVDHVAVCEGYAKAMQMLFNAKNIENVFVTGKGGSGGHAWNQVKIHGEYYNLDTTWDDLDQIENGGVDYTYFNMKDCDFTVSHIANNPECSTATKEYLYDTEECVSDEYTWENVHKDKTLSAEDCTDEKILEYVVDQINRTSEIGSCTVNMCGENYDTAKAILNYIQSNQDKILNDNNLIEDFSDKYKSTFRYSALANGNTKFKLFLSANNSIAALDVDIPDELNIYFSNNTKYLTPLILPGSTTDEIEWYINRPRIATIDTKKGVIVPISAGKAIITVHVGDAFDACLLTVQDPSNFVYKDDLQKLYDENKNKYEYDYTSECWIIFEEALFNARDVLDNEYAVQSDVDSAVAQLKDAVDSLK